MMDLVFDTALLSLFGFVLCQNLFLQRKITNEREFFIKTLNHDFKVSTLAQIRGVELLKHNLAQKTKVELLLDIEESCKYNLDMVNTLINGFRFENGVQVLNYEKFSFSKLIEEVWANIKSKSELKNVHFFLKSELTYINADMEMIRKVFSILLMLAVSNSYFNKGIKCLIKETENKIKILLIYEGKPLTEEECRRMFSKNPRFSTVGFGARMYLCKKIIEFHKGRIEVKSFQNGENVFEIVLPINNNKEKMTKLKIQNYISKCDYAYN